MRLNHGLLIQTERTVVAAQISHLICIKNTSCEIWVSQHSLPITCVLVRFGCHNIPSDNLCVDICSSPEELIWINLEPKKTKKTKKQKKQKKNKKKQKKTKKNKKKQKKKNNVFRTTWIRAIFRLVSKTLFFFCCFVFFVFFRFFWSQINPD